MLENNYCYPFCGAALMWQSSTRWCNITLHLRETEVVPVAVNILAVIDLGWNYRSCNFRVSQLHFRVILQASILMCLALKQQFAYESWRLVVTGAWYFALHKTYAWEHKLPREIHIYEILSGTAIHYPVYPYIWKMPRFTNLYESLPRLTTGCSSTYFGWMLDRANQMQRWTKWIEPESFSAPFKVKVKLRFCQLSFRNSG